MAQDNYLNLFNERVDINEAKPASTAEQSIINSFQSINPQQKTGSVEMGSLYNPFYQNQYKPRYEAALAYDRLGFDPRRDNEALYNKEMSGFDSFQRAAVQTGNLALAAAKDTITFGANSKDTTLAFEMANAIGGSTKGGVGGFLLNTMISSGYTIGIIGEMVLENLVVGALTGGAGNLALMATYGAKLNTARRLWNIKNASKAIKTADYLNAMKNQAKVTNAMEKMSMSTKLGDFAKSAVEFINPLENTTSFIKDVKGIEQVGGALRLDTKVAKGMTALWTDVQAVRNAYTESAMEGNFAQKDMEDEFIRTFKYKYGRNPNEDEYAKFKTNALGANYATTMINLPVIFLTNKMTLAPLFRSLGKISPGQVMNIGTKRTFFDITKHGMFELKELPKEFSKRMKIYAKNPALWAKNAARYSVDNFFEGFQETTQDVISGSAKEYYGDNYNNSLRGSWYNYMLSNANNQISAQGLETFASGFIMQTFIKPLQTSFVGAYRGLKGDTNTMLGKMVDKIDDMRHDQKYIDEKKKTRDAEDEQFKKELEDINFLFNNAGNYLNENFEMLAKTKHFTERLDRLYAGRDFDELSDTEKTKVVEETRNHLNGYVVNLINKGYYDTFVDQIKNMSNFYKNNSTEFENEYGKEQTDAFKNNADGIIEMAKQIKVDYDEITSTVKKPFSDEDIKNAETFMDNTSAAQRMKMANIAYNKAVSEYVFMKSKLRDGLNAQQEIERECQNIFNGDNMTMYYDDLSSIYDLNLIERKRKELTMILDGTKEAPGLRKTKESMRSKELQDEIDRYEKHLNFLTEIKKNMDSVFSDTREGYDVKTNKKAIVKKTKRERNNDRKNLRDNIREYIQFMDSQNNATPERKKSTYTILSDKVTDYIITSNTNKYNNDVIQFFSDPSIFMKHVSEIAKSGEKYFNAREEEIKESIRLAEESADSDDIVNELLSIGVVCEDLDTVRITKKMPEKLIDSESKKEINYLDKKYAEAVDILKRHIPNLIDIPITGSNSNNEQSIYFKNGISEEEFRRCGINLGVHSFNELIEKLKKLTANTDLTRYINSKEELLNVLTNLSKTKNIKVNIINNAKQAMTFDKNSVTLDLRYFSNNYKGGKVNILNSLLKGVISSCMAEELSDTNSELFNNLNELYTKTQEYIDNNNEQIQNDIEKKYPKEKAYILFDLIRSTDSLESFIQNVMTNELYQNFLASIEFKNAESPDNRNAFSKFVSTVKKLISKLIQYTNTQDKNTVLNQALSVITDYISDGESIGSSVKQNTVKQNTVRIKNINTLDIATFNALPKEYQDRIINTFKLENNNFESLTDDKILKLNEFKTFLKKASNSFNLRLILSEINAEYNFENEVNDNDVLFINIDYKNYPDYTDEEVEMIKKGNYSRQRIVLLSNKLLALGIKTDLYNKANASDAFSQFELDVLHHPSIAKEVQELINKKLSIKPTPQNIQDAVSTLINNLGFPRRSVVDLASDNPKALISASLDNLTLEQRRELVSVRKGQMKIVSDLNEIEDTFKSANDEDGVKALRENMLTWLSNLPRKLKTVTPEFIEQKAQERIDELKSAEEPEGNEEPEDPEENIEPEENKNESEEDVYYTLSDMKDQISELRKNSKEMYFIETDDEGNIIENIVYVLSYDKTKKQLLLTKKDINTQKADIEIFDSEDDLFDKYNEVLYTNAHYKKGKEINEKFNGEIQKPNNEEKEEPIEPEGKNSISTDLLGTYIGNGRYLVTKVLNDSVKVFDLEENENITLTNNELEEILNQEKENEDEDKVINDIHEEEEDKVKIPTNIIGTTLENNNDVDIKEKMSNLVSKINETFKNC